MGFSKSLFKSKTFYVNILMAVYQYSGILPIPPHALPFVVGGVNIALRLLTNQPVHVIDVK